MLSTVKWLKWSIMTPDYDWLYTRTRAGKDRTPERARALLRQLGNPEQHMQTIHVIGTNGKGSVCAMLEAGLNAGKWRVGKFTSPHLTHFSERIRVNQQEIPEHQVAVFVEWAKTHAPEMPFFELTLGLALQHFQQSGVEWAIMEAGVGGEKDATHALQDIAATLITNVDLDHQSTLGPTIRDIAKDKAGAIRAGVPVLTNATGEALTIIQGIAEDRDATLYTPESHPEMFVVPHPPRMQGSHQTTNAGLALAALRVLNLATPESCEAALNAQHAGRMEKFEIRGKTVLLDGAHNPHAARALAQSVQHADTLLFGIMARKDAKETLDALAPVAAHRVYTHPGELGLDPEALTRLHSGEVVLDALEALEVALERTPEGGTLLVAGSLYLIGKIRPKVLDRIQRSD